MGQAWSSDEEDEGPTTRPVLAEMNYSRRRLGAGKLIRKRQPSGSQKTTPARPITKRKARAVPENGSVTYIRSDAKPSGPNREEFYRPE